jgi:ankyrin repeat protein
MMAAHEGNLDRLKALIEAGGPVSAKGQHGLTALVAAEASHSVPVLEFLLEHGADVNARD